MLNVYKFTTDYPRDPFYPYLFHRGSWNILENFSYHLRCPQLIFSVYRFYCFFVLNPSSYVQKVSSVIKWSLLSMWLNIR